MKKRFIVVEKSTKEVKIDTIIDDESDKTIDRYMSEWIYESWCDLRYPYFNNNDPIGTKRENSLHIFEFKSVEDVKDTHLIYHYESIETPITFEELINKFRQFRKDFNVKSDEVYINAFAKHDEGYVTIGAWFDPEVLKEAFKK